MANCRKMEVKCDLPMNISLLYNFASHWSIGAAGRFFSSRFRVHNENHSCKPLVRYSNIGAEFIIKYEDDRISANLHAGSALKGTLRFANKSNHKAHTDHFNSSAYAGAEVEVKF